MLLNENECSVWESTELPKKMGSNKHTDLINSLTLDAKKSQYKQVQK